MWLEIIDDPKMGRLPDWLWRRAIELFLLAGENGNDGLLQPVTDLAWRLRTPEEKLTESLVALSEVGVVHETPRGWVVTHFKERQEPVSSTERVRLFRQRERNDDETEVKRKSNKKETMKKSDSVSVSVSVSDSEEGVVGGEIQTPVIAEFIAHFGIFLGKREQKRWEALVESVGFEQAQKIATWAEKKEIHMLNRGGLLDSMETAAKTWIEKSKPKNDTFLERLNKA